MQLVVQFREGEQDAANEIFNRYVRRLVGLARSRLSEVMQRRVDPEDAVQSAYRSFFRRVANDDISLTGGGDLWRLLAGITVNKVRGQVEFHTAKKRAVTREVAQNPFESTISLSREAVDVMPEAVDVTATIEELEAVMRDLEPKQRRILELRLNGESVKEISREVSRTDRTVRRTLNLIRDRLEERLQGSDS